MNNCGFGLPPTRDRSAMFKIPVEISTLEKGLIDLCSNRFIKIDSNTTGKCCSELCILLNPLPGKTHQMCLF